MASTSLSLATTESELRKREKRNKNFSTEEENVIQTMVDEHSTIINSKFSNEITNKAKQDIWETIRKSVNLLGVSQRSMEEIKDKWGNMTRKAKKIFTEYTFERKKTGGGPPPTDMSQATANIIDAMKDSASLCGIPGGIDCIVSESGYICEGQIEGKCASVPCPMDEAATPPAPSCEAKLSTSDQNPIRKKKKTVKFTQEMVLEQQHKVLLGQLKQQEIDMRNAKLKEEKLTLQVKLLQKVLDRESCLALNTSELLMSLIP